MLVARQRATGTPATLSREAREGKSAAVFAAPQFVLGGLYEIRTIQHQ
jgi:hypothetical protein